MKNESNVYIAGIGMITAVGFDTASTYAAVKAGISAYESSDFFDLSGNQITMAFVPNDLMSILKYDLDEGDRYNERHDRITKMTIYAVSQACQSIQNKQIVPLILAFPENQEDDEGLSPVIDNLEKHCESLISRKKYKPVFGDRSIGIETIQTAYQYLRDSNNDYILVGGSDSYFDYSRLESPLKAERLLSRQNMDGFAPGEAACFLLLTGKPELALNREGHVIALHPPGLSKEPGHLESDSPYLGEGLDRAFKQSHKNIGGQKITTIFSSMNGENHWAKEYGVAHIRNQNVFADELVIEHPADVYGDVGIATGSLLMAMAVEHIFFDKLERLNQVYSSSDGAGRASIVIEKIAEKS